MNGPDLNPDAPTVPFDPGQPWRADTPSSESSWNGFRLLVRVGQGGFGEVYRAWDPSLQREVALKLLLPGAVGGEAEYEAMLREARALAAVHHPNILPVHGIDRHNGRVGFWTDFVHGKTLSALLREQGKFGAREAASIGLDVAKALSAVHRAGLLHRDVKAENVMREEGGRILLMDFGLSSLEKRQTVIAGTPNYMAPELFRGEPNTIATDIYALGVMLFYLVAAEYPAQLGGLAALEALVKFAQRKPLPDLRPDLPDSLLRTVTTAIDVDPAKRFASAGQLATALAESLGSPAPPETASQVSTGLRPVRRRVKVLGITAAAALIAGFAAWRGLAPRFSHADKSQDEPSSRTTFDQYDRAQDLLLRSYKESNVAEAVKGFQAVLAADPNFALAHARLGTAYFIQYRNSHDGRLLEMAQESTSRALNLDPKLAPPYITLSRIAAMQGQTPLAMEQAQKALTLDPRSAEAYGALADVYAAQGNDKNAIESYQKAIDLAPDDWRWPVRLGAAELETDISDAMARFQRGIELAPDNAVAYYDLGLAEMRSGQLKAAQNALEKALGIEPTALRYNELGTILLLEGEYDRAASTFDRSIALNPNDYAAWGNLAVAYRWSQTNRAKEEAAYRKAIGLAEAEHAKKRDEPELLVSLADYYASTGDPGKARPMLRQALALAPDDYSVAYEAGETYESLGERARAIPLIARAIANGYYKSELEHNPDLAALRADPNFAAALDRSGKNK